MLEQLEQLAQRIDELAALTRNLREENHSLRQQLHEAQGDARTLRIKLDTARERVEALIEKLPTTE